MLIKSTEFVLITALFLNQLVAPYSKHQYYSDTKKSSRISFSQSSSLITTSTSSTTSILKYYLVSATAAPKAMYMINSSPNSTPPTCATCSCAPCNTINCTDSQTYSKYTSCHLNFSPKYLFRPSFLYGGMRLCAGDRTTKISSEISRKFTHGCTHNSGCVFF